MYYLGIDTSQYTTSVALIDSFNRVIYNERVTLRPKNGNSVIRQNESVFLHTKNLHVLIDKIFDEIDSSKIVSIGVSDRPKEDQDSYMPCFLAGLNVANVIGKALKIDVYCFDNQKGNIASSLLNLKSDLFNKSFISIHLSKNSTEICEAIPDTENIFKVNLLGKTLDIGAGQVIDTVGNFLNIYKPTGHGVDFLANKSNKTFFLSVKNKKNFYLNGIINSCKQKISNNEIREDICKFCLIYIIKTLDNSLFEIIKENNLFDKKLIFSGGVSCNSFIRQYFGMKYNCHFTDIELSSDNGTGVALLAKLRGLK
ncbi:MAG: hypothetical protein ACRCZK_02315 [Oscillospiraceae bacterium]